ncbi:hypothetical protein B296_00028072 [Ensete ventricosum]|uniref:Uncharacterized protein n=1 Tax=Ensete ventricosum TaxID=4639 RepID=A0A426X203_ENSVE|nr:hypothetical protein B296_00028072 [Ensete ventricosum]
MILNRVESFYVFFLRFRSEGSEEEGQPATTNPHARSATHGQGQPVREADTTRRDNSPQGRPAPLTGEAARRGGAYRHDRLRLAYRGGIRQRAHPLAAWHP